MELELGTAQLGRLLSGLCSTENSFSERILRDGEGRRVAVPTIPSDTVARLIARIERSGGNGTAVIFDTIDLQGSLEEGELTFTLRARFLNITPSSKHEDSSHIPVSSSTTIKDLLDIMTENASISVQVDDSAFGLTELPDVLQGPDIQELLQNA